MFLDEEENIREEVAVPDGFPLKDNETETSLESKSSNGNKTTLERRRRSTYQEQHSGGVHIVYKRSTPEMFSDYGEFIFT